jgi:hypothetical protein
MVIVFWLLYFPFFPILLCLLEAFPKAIAIGEFFFELSVFSFLGLLTLFQI